MDEASDYIKRKRGEEPKRVCANVCPKSLGRPKTPFMVVGMKDNWIQENGELISRFVYCWWRNRNRMRVSSQRKGNHRVLGWRCLPLNSKKETDNLDGQSLIITGAYPVWGKEDSTGLTRTYVQQVTLDYFRKKEVGMRCTLLEGRLEKHKGATEILADQTWNRWDPGYFWGLGPRSYGVASPGCCLQDEL